MAQREGKEGETEENEWRIGHEATTGTAGKPDSLSQGGGMTWEFRAGVRSYSLRAKSSPTPVPLCGVQAGSGFKLGWIFVTDVTIENTNFEIQLREMLTPQKKNPIPFLSRLRLFQKLYFIIVVVVF